MNKAKLLFLAVALIFAGVVFCYARNTAKYAQTLPAGLDTAISE